MRPVGGVGQGQAEGFGNFSLKDVMRFFRVQFDVAANQMCWIDITQDQIGIGDRRVGTPQIVAHRSGKGPSALRSGLKRAAPVDPDDRAATSSHFRQVDRRYFEHVARAREQPGADHDAAPNLVLQRPRHLAALDQGCFGRGATHIEGNDIGQTEGARQGQGPNDAAGRAGFNNVHGFHRRFLLGGQAAIGLHEK